MQPSTKNKAVSFNLLDPVERSMYDFADNLKKNKQSFSGLLKNLLLIYMANTGNAPPGLAYNQVKIQHTQKIVEPKKPMDEDRRGMIENMPFSDD